MYGSYGCAAVVCVCILKNRAKLPMFVSVKVWVIEKKERSRLVNNLR
jgi:hypothetical protein